MTERGGFGALTPEQRARWDEGQRAIRERWGATVRDFVDHIDYAVKLIGVDHVGISSDFGGGGGIVGWQDASETRNVTAELEARGYSRSRHREALERQPAARLARGGTGLRGAVDETSDRELSTSFGYLVLIYCVLYFNMLNDIREK